MVDNVLDGVASGATGLVSGVSGAVKGVGKSVMSGLDKPFNALTGKEGPHRMADRAADGFVDAGVGFVNTGIVGSVQKFGKGIMRALDHPLEQLHLDKMEMPKLGRKK